MPPTWLWFVVTGILLLVWYSTPELEWSIVVAFVPWMAVGATLVVIGRVGTSLPSVLSVDGMGGAYLWTVGAAGLVWLGSSVSQRTADDVATASAVGSVGVVVLVVLLVRLFSNVGSLSVGWPLLSVGFSLAVTLVSLEVVAKLWPEIAERWSPLAALVVFGHVLDGVTTLVGVDVLGFIEQTPLSRAILAFTRSLPLANSLGVGWMFLGFKIVLAYVIVIAVPIGFTTDRQLQNLLIAIGIATGFVPGVHNVLLYLVAT